MRDATSDEHLACVMGGMDLVRPLGLAGVPCAVVAKPGKPQTYSRFAREVIPFDEVWSDTERLLTELLSFAARQRRPPILFYEQDEQLLFVARHRNHLARAFRFVLADPKLVETLVDKARFQALAERLALPVPRTCRIRPAASSFSGLDLRFPAVVKPLMRDSTWDATGWNGKALTVETPAVLRDLWPRLAEVGTDFLVQEMIPGPESRIESYHVYVDPYGEVVAEFTGRKIRTYPISLGQSTALEITDQPDVVALGREIVWQIGLRGVAKLDFKRDPDGKLHLLEVNPRFNLWHHLGAVAGVNLPALVYADMSGVPRPATGRARPGARWCSPRRDMRAAKEAGIPFWSWLPWAIGCEAKAVLARDDPMPTLHGMLGLLPRMPRPHRGAAAVAQSPAGGAGRP